MGAEEVEGSFKKPGAIPFKWETRPGVPKPDQPDPQTPPYKYNNIEEEEDSDQTTSHSSTPSTPAPPITPPPRTQSLRSISRLRSDYKWHHSDLDSDADPPLLSGPESASIGCFLSPRLKWKWGWKKLSSKTKDKPKLETKPESDHQGPRLDLLTRWSMSTRKSLSPLRGSPSFLSFSSRASSP